METKIKNTIEKIKQCQLNLQLADELNDLLIERELRLSEIDYELDKLNVSIQKLSNLTIISIYQTLINKKDKRLELEKQYYLKLSVEYNQLVEDTISIKSQITIFKKEGQKLKEYKKILKEQLRLKKGSLNQKQLSVFKRIFSEIDKKIQIIKEMKEAIKQGSKLNLKLNYAIKSLDKIARNEHNLFKGSKINPKFIVDLNKYQKRISDLVVAAKVLQKEVKDIFEVLIGAEESIIIDIDLFEQELGFSLISDLFKPNSFKSSLHTLENYKFNLMIMTKSLRTDVKKIEKEIKVLEKEENKIFKNIDVI